MFPLLVYCRLLRRLETLHLGYVLEVQAFEIETADDSGIMPKASHEYACRLVGGPNNLGYTCRDRKNHLRSKRQRELAYGQAARLNKKEVQSKNLRRKKNWLDKLLKGKHRVTKGPTKQGEKANLPKLHRYFIIPRGALQSLSSII